MRRLLAIAIIALLGTTLAAPLFASAASSLPQCCRRNGAHHCMAGMTDGAERSFSRIAPKCPDYPRAAAVPSSQFFAAAGSGAAGAPLFTHPASAPQTGARYRISYARSRQKRGPPTATAAL
jgi:hypothetical protein